MVVVFIACVFSIVNKKMVVCYVHGVCACLLCSLSIRVCVCLICLFEQKYQELPGGSGGGV